MNEKDEVRNGIYVEYHENGQLAERIPYKDGKREGLCRVYHDNGQLARQFTCKNDKFDGVFEWWYRNGQQAVVGTYENGTAIGSMRGGIKMDHYEKEPPTKRVN